MPRFLRTIAPLFVILLAGCGIEYPELDDDIPSDSEAATDAPGSDGAGSDDGTDPLADGDETGDTASPMQIGLPCEVSDLLARRCQGCHGATPIGAPMSLVTHEDLVDTSFSDPDLSFAERALVRMAVTDNPMPPAPATAATPEEQMAFAAWVDAGMPTGDCSDEPAVDPFDVPPMCSTSAYWDDDDDGTPLMYPGRACLTCHEIEAPDDDDVPNLLVGGTVFETAHEPNDCKGPPGELDGEPIVVEVTSADGETVSLPVNSSGNFLMHASATPFPAPYLVKVVHGDRERAMPIPAPSGDCNSCHTQDGQQGAPGRVVLP